MSENEKKTQLWESVLAEKSFLKKKDDTAPAPDIKSKIDKVYDELEIEKRYEQIRDKDDATDAPLDGPRAS